MPIKPAHYFCSEKEVCVPIRIMDVPAFKEWQKKADIAAVSQAKNFSFQGFDTQMAFIHDAKGELDQILFGTNLQRLPATVRSLAPRLPEGAYWFDLEIPQGMADVVAYYWALGQYNFGDYRSQKGPSPKALRWPANANKKRVEALIAATNLTRDLINTPPNDMGPDELEDQARALATGFDAKIKITKGDALLIEGFPAIHAVGKAAQKEPRLLDITWGDEKNPKVTICGKGVCFDTGGLDLKSASNMITMKKDMGGAAVALGLARAIMEMGLKLRLRVLIPAVENSVAGNAYRPSDVIKTRKGYSVEIGNTDAEGRVVLCDAMALADEEKPEIMIDFATLTGAARTALGPDLGVLYSTSDELASGLQQAGMNHGDPLWRMPLWQPYRELLKSEVADINNVASTPQAGSITAALYLQSFLENTKAWAHLDIYCWNDKQKPGKPKGAEAHGLLSAYGFLEGRFGK